MAVRGHHRRARGAGRPVWSRAATTASSSPGTSAAGQLVAFTAAGTGTTWLPTGSLGEAGTESVVGATVASAGAIVAVGYTAPSQPGQQPVFLAANAAGSVRPVSLAGIPGGSIPELAVNGLAVAAGQQIAVGSAEGYPAVWRRSAAGSWALVTSLPQVAGRPGLAALTGVTHGSSGWLAVGAPGPVVMTSADGTSWQPATGPGSITAAWPAWRPSRRPRARTATSSWASWSRPAAPAWPTCGGHRT